MSEIEVYTTLLRQFSLSTSKSVKVLRLIDRRQSFRNPIPFIVIFDTTLAFFLLFSTGYGMQIFSPFAQTMLERVTVYREMFTAFYIILAGVEG